MDVKLMTVGEIAKEANVSVRTMQYYDKSGLLKPSDYSEGGNRLYSSKDLVMLFQIKSLKYLGLSLDEIKQQLISLDVPDKVLEIMHKQKIQIFENIQILNSTLSSIEFLENGIKESNCVDFVKYANIISETHNKWKAFWPMNFWDIEQDLLDHVIHKFSKESSEIASLLEKVSHSMNAKAKSTKAEKEHSEHEPRSN